MTNQSNIDERIKELKQKHIPKRDHYPVLRVRPGEDKAEAVVNDRKQHNIPDGARLHVVSFMGAK